MRGDCMANRFRVDVVSRAARSPTGLSQVPPLALRDCPPTCVEAASVDYRSIELKRSRSPDFGSVGSSLR
jgi:hypothetical protein